MRGNQKTFFNMEIFYDSFKIWVTIDGEDYIWVQPENGEGWWDGDSPGKDPEEFFQKVDQIWKILFGS